MKINSTTPDKHEFTKLLTHVADCPKKLYFIGNLPKNGSAKRVAIVGARKITPYGKEIAYQLAYQLARRGAIVISGLALGTDGEVHRGALAANGITIAVMANGVDRIYPSSHTQLAREILQKNGAILSEYEPGTPPMQYRFLARNRIISGLSDAVVVVEAAARSGTLSTVTRGLSQGKDIYAVPGHITSPQSAGCNRLIAQGAEPIISVESFVDELCPVDKKSESTLNVLGDTVNETLLLQLIADGVRSGDDMLQQSNLPVAEFNQTLSMLEIKGDIRALGNNNWTMS